MTKAELKQLIRECIKESVNENKMDTHGEGAGGVMEPRRRTADQLVDSLLEADLFSKLGLSLEHFVEENSWDDPPGTRDLASPDDWGRFHVVAYTKDRRRVGTASFAVSSLNGKMVPVGVSVDKEFRRKGVATALYDEAKRLTKGKDLGVDNRGQSEDGKGFRGKYDQPKKV